MVTKTSGKDIESALLQLVTKTVYYSTLCNSIYNLVITYHYKRLEVDGKCHLSCSLDSCALVQPVAHLLLSRVLGYIPCPIKVLVKHELGANEIHFLITYFCGGI